MSFARSFCTGEDVRTVTVGVYAPIQCDYNASRSMCRMRGLSSCMLCAYMHELLTSSHLDLTLDSIDLNTGAVSDASAVSHEKVNQILLVFDLRFGIL